MSRKELIQRLRPQLTVRDRAVAVGRLILDDGLARSARHCTGDLRELSLGFDENDVAVLLALDVNSRNRHQAVGLLVQKQGGRRYPVPHD